MTVSELEQRIAELEALVEEHARQLEHGAGSHRTRRGISRRSLLQSLGVIGLGGYAAGQATADPQGQLGTGSDPVREVYTEALNGGITSGASITDLLGDGLTETSGTLEATVTDATNRGNGTNVFGGNTGGTLGFRSLVGGTNISLSSTSDEVTIDADSVGEKNTASNTGSGAGLFKEKAGVDLVFRSLTTSGALAVTENSDTVSLAAPWADPDDDDLLEPVSPYTGIDAATVQADAIQGAGGNTHLTLTSSGPLTLGQTLDTDGNAITNTAGNVTLGSILDLSANDLVDGATTIWDTSAGYIPQGRLENDAVTVTAGTGLTGGGSVALGASATVGIATGGVDTTELADSSVTSAKIATDAVTGDEIDLSTIAGNNITVNGTKLDATSANMVENADGYLEPDTGFNGIDSPVVRTPEIRDAGNSTHLTLTSSGPLTLGQTLDTDGNTITNNAGNVALGSILDLSANDLVDGATTIWDTSAGYIPQGRLENASLTVSAGDGLKNGGSVALGATTTLDVEPADFAGTFLSDDGTDDLTVDIGNGLEDDGSGNLRVDPGGIAGNGLTEDTATTLGIATGGVDTTELADNSVTSAKIAGNAVTGTEINLGDIAGDNITVDTTEDKLDVSGATPNMVDSNGDDLLEPVSPYTGIDAATVQADAIQGAGGNTHMTLTSGGPLTLSQPLQMGTNPIRSGSGQALTFQTDTSKRTLQLGDPKKDNNDNIAGGNILGGHPNNAINGSVGIVIAGGGASNGNQNSVNGDYTTVSGGQGNSAVGGHATTGGGQSNSAGANHATVGGGQSNSAGANHATIGGGELNSAGGKYSTVAGGYDTSAGADYGTVGGGQSNNVTGSHATVGGGQSNNATGLHATVPGGKSNSATGNYSWAGGRLAKTKTSGDPATNHDGAFVWGDGTTTTVRSQADNQFVVQASNGVYVGDDGGPGGDFYSNSKLIDTSSGAHLTTSGTWKDSSSRTVKENITPVDGPSILETVEALPVSEWSYENDDDGVRHMGPMAEDFYEAFGLGGDDKHIASLDTAGVALAAVKGLAERLETKDERLEQQAEQIDDLEAEREALEAEVEAKDDRIDDLESRLERVEAALDLDE